MKKALAMILALVMVFGLCACGSTGSGSASTSAGSDNYDTYAAEYGTVDGAYRDITIATRVDIEHLKPTSGTGEPKNGFYWNVFECLFDLDNDGNLYPDLATGYTAGEDEIGPYWDITLFQGIKDSQGNDITAEDVVASNDWLINAGEALKYEDVVSYEAVDEYTFRIRWDHFPESLNDYEFPLCRTFIFDSQYTGDDFAKEPVGTGNYIVVDFTTGSSMTLWATPNYWAYSLSEEEQATRMNIHSANVQMITYEVIGESATAEVALEEGTIDFCNYISQSASIEKFQTEYADKYNVEVKAQGSYFFVEPNMDSSNILSGDENLRLAIFYALDNDAIAQVMGSSYVAMKTLGHRGFNDFNLDWENDETYVNTTNTDLAKEYLSKSNYNGETLKIMCKSGETERNCAVSILSQLQAVGINCELAAVDSTTFQTDTSVVDGWDLIVFEMGGTSLSGSLSLPLGNPNTNEDGTDSWSLNFIRDSHLVELVETAQADATKGDESLKALIDYAIEQAYIYPVAYSMTCYIYSKDITELYYREQTPTVAAFTYAGQTTREETAQPLGSDEAAFDPSLAGTYTYSEAPMFGDKDNEFTLTLNADGTYRLDECNSVNENVYTEGTWTSDGNAVTLSAEPVQGDGDRMLVDWVGDMNNPAPTFIVNTDGTMAPVMAVDLSTYAGTYTYSEAGTFGSKDNDFTLTLNADGTYRCDCNNSVGEDIYIEGTFEANADGSLHVNAPEAGVQGDMDKFLNSGWAADDTAPEFDFTVNEDGTFAPVGVEAAAEDAAAEEAPAEEAATEDAAASDEVPGIVTGLISGGFECFTYTEESDFGTFVWYILKSDDMVIVVTPNPNLGTSDGLGVWHFTSVTEDKGVLTLSGIEEADKSLPTMGPGWTDKDNYVMQWQITGPDSVSPVA